MDDLLNHGLTDWSIVWAGLTVFFFGVLTGWVVKTSFPNLNLWRDLWKK